ncbi:STAS/SEC14 domain-containing protein [Virgibacillus sp. 179-BFC.A HS]|uniref:STAS/SEC14 domain-containing protein n=1 Tax=Tigheibacillus jepli TaxID=3035914 RepID=A0ABU5CEU6_9BACI|nr:STAS/SEC14 domain-containing protein [Virgibacillus sp. 179-BFC.A HS]MDY0404853.1 STAS/SEC14 domain-containing protein [Virgibacillus sp. 179-BFC.A HS]
MLEVKGQEQGKRLEFYTEGTATQEDLQTFKEALQEKTLQEEPLNILFVFKNIEGVTPNALIEDMKTFPDLKSIKKGAIVADDTFTKTDAMIANLIPGVEVAQFSLDEMEKAREWLQQ